MRSGHFCILIITAIVYLSIAHSFAEPVVYWPLDIDASDASGNELNGTVLGNPVWSLGYIDSAIELDGVDDYIEIEGYQGITGTDARTNTPTGGLPATDLDGNPRVVDGDGDSTAVVDMGAYEFQVD